MKRLVVGISGASGMPIAAEVLRLLRDTEYEVHLIMTDSARLTIPQETDLTPEDFCRLADVVYPIDAIGAAVSSGSFTTAGMLVVPCSMKTAAGIHSGYSDNLLLRAADVTLKEHITLVLCARECPLSPIHLRNLYELSLLGVRIIPPMLSYYTRPESVAECTAQIAGKLLEPFGVETEEFHRWQGV